MTSEEEIEKFVLDYVSSYPDEVFHDECVEALTTIVSNRVAEARKEQVEFDIYALWARGGVATPSGLKITIAEAENTIRENFLNAIGESDEI